MSNSKKNIVCLSSWYPSEKQPFLGNFIQRQIELLGTKYAIQFVQTQAVADQKNFEVKHVIYNNYTEITATYPAVRSKLLKKYYQTKALKKALQTILQPDLLLTYIFLPKIWQFLLLKKQLNIPWIHIEQGSYFRKEIQSNWNILQRFWIKKAYQQVDTLLAASDFLARDMKVVDPTRTIKRVKNHIDTKLFSYKAKEIRSNTHFLHVSTLDKQTKNPKGMFDAMHLLSETTSAFLFTIVSDEPTHEWKSYVTKLGIAKNVRFIAPQKWEQLPAFYHEADALILNSIYETFSIVLAEAWATGTPTISTSVGIAFNAPEFLGLHVESNNTESLAAALLTFIATKDQYDTAKISDYAQQYNAELVLTELESEIDQLITT